MQGDGGHGMHVGFCNVLDDDGYVIVPGADSFIVRGGDKPTIFVDKCDRIDGTQVLVVFLRDVARIHIVLRGRVRAGCEETRWRLVPELFSCPTCQQERCAVCHRRGGSGRRRESCRY